MESLLTATAEYLTRQSVQIVVVFVLVAVVCWALRKTSAHWRYLLWLVVLAKCLAPGLIRVPLAVLPQETDLQQTSPVATPQPVAAPSTTAVLVVAATTEPEMPIASPQPITTPAGTTQLETAAPSAGQSPGTTSMSDLNLKAWLAAVWSLGVAVFLGHVAIKARTTHRRLRRTRRMADAEIRTTVVALAHRLGLKRIPTVYVAERIGQPFVWGWPRGSIYVPQEFAGWGTRDKAPGDSYP